MEIGATQKLKILIIEDDIVDRKLLQRLLSQSTLPVSEIKSAECLKTALEFLGKEHFDVVFLDLGLPDSQGIESFSEIHGKTPNVPVIVLSGLGDEEMAVKAVKQGVQDYFVKGQIDSNLMARAVRYAIERKKAAEQLRQAEEKYRIQFEGALDAIFVADAETGILTDCNPAATRLVGREESELIGQHQKILHPSGQLEGGYSRSFKQHLGEKQGQLLEEIRDVAITASLLEVGGKKVLQGIFRDITERKRAEAVIKQEKEFAESMFNTAPVIILVLDTNARIVNFNPSMRETSGYNLGEVKGKDWFDTFVPERDRSRVKEIFKQAINGVDTKGNINPIVTKSGREVLVEWYSKTLKDKNGNIIGLIAIGQDITERKKAEQERQLAEEKYRTIFENSAAAITLVNEKEQIISWNKFTEDLLGMCKEDLYLRPVKSLYSGGQWEKIRTLNIVQKGIQRHLETKMIRKDGRLIDVDVSLSVLKDVEGKILGSIGVTTDITERKRAEEELKEAMETKSQFISTVSHELRTPLASMKEAISIVLEEVAGKINKDQKNFLNIAQKNIDRLAKLINEVLDFQKLSASKMKFNMRENDIGEVMKDACHTMTLFAEKKKVKLSVKLDDDLPKARFDSDGIMQVLTNLISNSIKFTPENGQVSISVQHKGEDLAIQISDTGMGISKENLPKLFTPFYQVHQPGQQAKGTGLGLAIVSKIVTAHKGRIEVESEVGQGTTFTVFLPLDGRPAPEVLPEKMDELLEKTIVDSQTRTK
jgi:PAS domain S-box-containing protein